MKIGEKISKKSTVLTYVKFQENIKNALKIWKIRIKMLRDLWNNFRKLLDNFEEFYVSLLKYS